jgi:SAM-dependent methyltransferase
VIFGGKSKGSFAIWPGRLMRTWIRGPQLSPLHDPDNERFACRLDDLAGDDREVVDVAALTFPDGSFDLVISTLSLHHWADPAVGLAEIGRVLRPGGRALVWDFRPGAVPLHRHVPDPVQHARGAPLRVASAAPWRWPWRFSLTRRIELVRNGERA